MTRPFKALTLIGFAALCWTGSAIAQDLHPSRRPSPMGVARITLDETYVKVVYSRPYKRGRENIFGTEQSGALVPYGKIWRTGANEATELTTTGDLLIGGKPLAAGTYSLFTTPGERSWKIHVNSSLGLSGTGYFDAVTREFKAADLPSTDVLVLAAPVGSLEKEVDQFTIALDADPEGNGADLCLRWIETEVCTSVAVP